MQAHLPQIDLDKMQAVLDIETRYVTGKITLEEGRKEVAERVGKLRPVHLAFIEQTLIEHTDEECIRENMAQKIQLFEGYMDYSRPDVPEDHPLSRYYQENEEMKRLLLAVEDLVQYPVIKNQWLELFDQLRKYPIHYSRKQNQLYPLLEQKGFDRPTTTMWTFDDMVRDNIRDAYNLLEAGNEEEFIKSCKKLISYGRDLMEKEETILYPTSYAMITAEEFEDMKEGDLEIGYAFFTPAEKRVKGTTVAGKSTDTSASSAPEAAGFATDLQQLLSKYGYSAGGSEKLDVTTGKLTLEQINLIYQHLPFDISFVDENELVCFYTDTKHRVFPRSKNVIGRDVKNCHPKASVHIVEEIIKKFRSGEQDKAEFWINKPDLFIYIIYYAVRDEKGKFRGVLEMMQDVTRIRSLEGKRTLVTWERPKKSDIKAEETKKMEQKDNPYGLTENTVIGEIVDKYPYIKEFMPTLSPTYKKLMDPVQYMIMSKVATLDMIAMRGGFPVEEIIEKISDKIRSEENK